MRTRLKLTPSLFVIAAFGIHASAAGVTYEGKHGPGHGKYVVLVASKTYEKYSCNSTVPGWEGGFGRKVLGETWEEPLGHYGHHGLHGKQSTRVVFAPGADNSPILRGIKSGEIWVPTEAYEVR